MPQEAYCNHTALTFHRRAGVPIRIGYVLRNAFVAGANACLPLAQQNRPFTLEITPLTQRNLRHSCLIDTQTLEDDFTGQVPNATATRIREWHGEETAARTGGLWMWLAVIVVWVRGHWRNAVT